MINSKALTDLLSENSDEKFCKRWFLMTLNGTLLAYTQPTDSKDLRKQAAMAALSWQEQHQDLPKTNAPDTRGLKNRAKRTSPLQTLTIESESSNMIIRKVHSQLLLILEGGVPPRRRGFEHRVTPESAEDAPYPSQDTRADPVLGSSVSSATDSVRSTAATGILALQRRKMDALATAITEDFERTGFKMPEEGNVKFF